MRERSLFLSLKRDGRDFYYHMKTQLYVVVPPEHTTDYRFNITSTTTTMKMRHARRDICGLLIVDARCAVRDELNAKTRRRVSRIEGDEIVSGEMTERIGSACFR